MNTVWVGVYNSNLENFFLPSNVAYHSAGLQNLQLRNKKAQATLLFKQRVSFFMCIGKGIVFWGKSTNSYCFPIYTLQFFFLISRNVSKSVGTLVNVPATIFLCPFIQYNFAVNFDCPVRINRQHNAIIHETAFIMFLLPTH